MRQFVWQPIPAGGQLLPTLDQRMKGLEVFLKGLTRTQEGAFKFDQPVVFGAGISGVALTDLSGNLPASRVSAGTFGAGDYTFPGEIIAGVLIRRNAANSFLSISGGEANNNGANYLLGGPSHPSLADTHRWRQAGTERMRLTDRLLIGTTAVGLAAAGGLRATGDSEFGGTIFVDQGDNTGRIVTGGTNKRMFIAGGNASNSGANLFLGGPSAAVDANVFGIRVGGTEIARFTDRLLIGTTDVGDTGPGGFRAVHNSLIDGRLTLLRGSSGGTLRNDTLRMDRSASNFIHMLSPSTAESGLLFGDEIQQIRGGILSNIAGDRIDFRTGGNTTRMVLTDRLLIGTTDNGLATAGGIRATGDSEFGGRVFADSITSTPGRTARFNDGLCHMYRSNGGDFGVFGDMVFESRSDSARAFRWFGSVGEMLRLEASPTRLIVQGTNPRLLIGTTANGNAEAGGIRATGRSQFDSHVDMVGLPTTNPGGSGRLWKDGTTLRIT